MRVAVTGYVRSSRARPRASRWHRVLGPLRPRDKGNSDLYFAVIALRNAIGEATSLIGSSPCPVPTTVTVP